MDDLKEIKQMVEDQKPRYLIADICSKKIANYKHEIDEFEKWAEAEVQNDAYLGGTVVSKSDDLLLQASPNSFPGEKNE
jgi:hypothetical protein